MPLKKPVFYLVIHKQLSTSAAVLLRKLLSEDFIIRTTLSEVYDMDADLLFCQGRPLEIMEELGDRILPFSIAYDPRMATQKDQAQCAYCDHRCRRDKLLIHTRSKHPRRKVKENGWQDISSLFKRQKTKGIQEDIGDSTTCGKDYESTFGEYGFYNWKKATDKFKTHEHTPAHCDAVHLMMQAKQRLKLGKTVNEEQLRAHERQVKQNRQVLCRLLDATLYLAKKNLPLRGHRETLPSTRQTQYTCGGKVQNEGNFLELVKLLSKYDGILANHIATAQMNASYLSPQIQKEFISTLASNVRSSIISEVKSAHYYGVILDSTIDISHVDQFSVCLRYVDEQFTIQERFILFTEIKKSDAKTLFETLEKTLTDMGLDIQMIRSQSYDGAANMRGHVSGLQARVKEVNRSAADVHCCAHNLNLVLADACGNCAEAVTFFGTIQKAIEDIAENDTFPETKAEARGLLEFMSTFEFVFMIGMWSKVLYEMSTLSEYMQQVSMDLVTASSLIGAAMKNLEQQRSNEVFNGILEEARAIATREGVTTEFKTTRMRRRKRMVGEIASVEPISDPTAKFKVNVYFAIYDTLVGELRSRFSDFQVMVVPFKCLMPGHMHDPKTFENLSAMYADDVDKDIAKAEYMQFCHFYDMTPELTGNPGDPAKTVQEMLHMIHQWDICNAFPNLTILYRILGTIAVSSATSERSFSRLKLTKTYLRSTMTETRLSSLDILSIERDFTEHVDFDAVIDTFSRMSVRRMKLH
ncbi:Zinc finger MYM-type protein 1 [Holothuria leucospilota]|uniref:Zinc finger MYM-type protein 1 n=1 Tax=Holothuria leucospilota TaxID=206669 RepID=A0A9Q1H3C6_HOLLE|nr:Zinc finger MYM-type protein 1 [Holothuria leucospilota]